MRLVLAVVHHRDTNVTHADVTRRRGWPGMALYRGRPWDRVGCSAGGSAQCQWLAGSRRPHCQTLPACRPARSWARPAIQPRLHAGGSGTRKFDLPVGPLKKNSPANACGGQGLRRAFFWTFSRFPGFSSPENPSFGDHKVPSNKKQIILIRGLKPRTGTGRKKNPDFPTLVDGKQQQNNKSFRPTSPGVARFFCNVIS